ncbi:MAG: LCP family protein [Chloroflexi bacterium]|nr:LCP family protein [Chloroflexota bacterium]
MRTIYRWIRRGLTGLFTLAVAAGILYFFYFTITSIVDEVQFRREETHRDRFREETATAIGPTLQAESALLTSNTFLTIAQPTEQGDNVIISAETEMATEPAEAIVPSATNTNEAPPLSVTPIDTATAEPSATDTVAPTSTPSPTRTSVPTRTPRPTNSPTVVAQNPTAFPTNTPPATAFPTNTPYPSDTPSPTNTFTPTLTFTPSITPSPTFTFTSSPTSRPTLIIEGTYATPVATTFLDIPIRAELVENDPNIVNIALLGTDATGGQTDVIIIVTINKETGTAAMWHLPRDLLVYIPGNQIDRINRVWQIGQQNGWPGGGWGLLKEMFLYNFGLQIDHYAKVNFNDFKAIIEELGGLTISVDCSIRDWRLIDPETPLDIATGDDWANYWEVYTMPIGVQTLDPYMALWYARSRVTTNDLDRGRRQMDILRAMWQQARDKGLFTQVATLWPRALEIIQTDMSLEDILGFVPMAVSLNPGAIERYSLSIGVQLENYTTPDDGRATLLGNWPAIRQVAKEFVTPPTGNRLQYQSSRIEIFDGTQYGLGWDQVASDRLAWEGFIPTIQDSRNVAKHEVTLIYDYTGEEKGSELDRLKEILRIGDSQVVVEPDPNREYDYRVVVGQNYNSCVYGSSTDDVPPPPQEVIN